MRNSQLAVVAALGIVLAVTVGGAVWVRLGAEPPPELSGERGSRTVDYSGFDRVDVSGQWTVTIERGEFWRVAVEAPVEIVDDVEVELDGNELSVEYDGGWCAGCFREDRALEVAITMPALASLELSGATVASFSGFDGRELTLDVSGAVEVRGAASRFQSLALDLSGAGSVDLGDVSVTDAEVDVSGAGNVTLRMAGGRLTGDMSGAANLEYYGTVSEEAIDKSGFVNVSRRD
jgi:hypothetical protein